MAKRWPAIKKHAAAKSMDSLSARKWSLGAATGKTDLGTERETPVLVYAFNWKQLSISAALGYRGDGKRCREWFQTRPGSYNDERLIVFLRDLKKHLRGQKAILIWDGLPAHKSRKMKQYLESQRSWLQIETLPGYSPGLNPVEDLWSNIKGQKLANRCVAGLGEAVHGMCSGMDRVRQSMLPFSFLHHAGLFLIHLVTLLREAQ
ncbi:MAG: transposase [Terracidiphilus sp.]|nr:transposase [Terracidiphilus sp.]